MKEKDELYQVRIKDLPSTERPRERLFRHGAHSLSTAELLAIVLRTGTGGENVVSMAGRLLARYGGLDGLASASPHQLSREHGIGHAKAAQIKAALELGKRLMLSSSDERPQITSPADAAALLMGEMAFLEQEHLRAIQLDTKHRVIEITTVAIGSLNTARLRLGDMFREAVRNNAAAIIVAHNHPSGDPTPSREDMNITREMIEAGKLLGIKVLDHLVIGKQQYVSLKEKAPSLWEDKP